MKNIKEKLKLNKIKLTYKQRVTIGVWLMVIGVVFLSSNYFMEKRAKAYETINFELSAIPTITQEEEDTPYEDINDTKKDEEKNKDVFVNRPYYVGRIEIPKIGLVKGFTAIDSKENNVDRNVAVMKGSEYPDVENGNFVLAAHNGNGWNCFFRYLHRLGIGDTADIYYKGYKYTYKLVNIYTQPITGKIKLYRNLKKTTLTLITCRSKTEQSVFVLELITKEKV